MSASRLFNNLKATVLTTTQYTMTGVLGGLVVALTNNNIFNLHPCNNYLYLENDEIHFNRISLYGPCANELLHGDLCNQQLINIAKYGMPDTTINYTWLSSWILLGSAVGALAGILNVLIKFCRPTHPNGVAPTGLARAGMQMGG